MLTTLNEENKIPFMQYNVYVKITWLSNINY